MKRFAGKCAVVTGGAGGIGRELCLTLSSLGIRVIIADLSEEQGLQLENMINSQNKQKMAKFVKCDVTKVEEIRKTIEEARNLGGLGIMFNNAGLAPAHEFYTLEPRNFRKLIDVNLTAVIDGTALAIEELQREKTHGVIVNTASMAGLLAMGETPIYCATKAGVVHFTRSLEHLQHENIRVLGVCPTYVDTAMIRQHSEQIVEGMIATGGGTLLTAKDVVEGMILMIENESGPCNIMRITLQKGYEYVTPKKVIFAKKLSRL